MHWLFLMSSEWLFLLDSEWSIPPGSNNIQRNSGHIYSQNLDLILVFGIYSEFLVAISSRNWLYSEFPVIFIPRNWFSTKPEKPKSRFNSKPKSHFLEIIPIISRYYVLVPPRITLLSTRKSTFRDEKKPSLFPFS